MAARGQPRDPPRPSTRDVLATYANASSLPMSANVGLWLDRFLPTQSKANDDQNPKADHVAKVAAISCPDGWSDAVKQWETALRATPRPSGNVVRLFTAKTTARCVVGLGAESPWENSLRLHHTWGVPILPGSALKGLASSFAHKRVDDTRWRKVGKDKDHPAGDAHKTMFGDTSEQGVVVFHDSLWAPDNADNGIRIDVMTVHHADYYGGKDKPPADWDDPNPVPFLSVSGTFVVALEGPTKWVDAAAEILRHGLIEDGVGAKTSSGYGRFELDERLSEQEQKRAGDLRKWKTQAEALGRVKLPSEAATVDDYLKDAARIADDALRAEVLKRAINGAVTTEFLNERARKLIAKDEALKGPLASLLIERAPSQMPVSPGQTWDLAAVEAKLPSTRDDAAIRLVLEEQQRSAGGLPKASKKALKKILEGRFGKNEGGWMDKLIEEVS